MNPSSSATLRLVLGAALCASLSCAHAGDDDAIDPDRPNVTNSSQVVGRDRAQVEAGIQWERERGGDVHRRTLTTPVLLRFGVTDALELRIDTGGRTIEHAVDTAGGTHATAAGYADTAFGLKWHLADQDGGKPALGLIGEVALPTGSTALRGTGARPILELPMEWELRDGWSLGVMPGLGRDSDENGARYGYGVFGATLGKALTERLHGFAELAAPQIARASHGGTQAVFDAGVTWLVNRDCQLDAMLVHGLNERTPDLTLAFGVSIRR